MFYNNVYGKGNCLDRLLNCKATGDNAIVSKQYSPITCYALRSAILAEGYNDLQWHLVRGGQATYANIETRSPRYTKRPQASTTDPPPPPNSAKPPTPSAPT
jgi:hypothetical protein